MNKKVLIILTFLIIGIRILGLVNQVKASLSDNLVAYYKMNDNADTTTVIDSKGYSNGTAQQNTSVLHTAGVAGEALTFNGTSDYVDVYNEMNKTFVGAFDSDFSFVFWAKTDKQGSVSAYEKWFNEQDQQLISYDIGPLYFGMQMWWTSDGTLIHSIGIGGNPPYSNWPDYCKNQWAMYSIVVKQTTLLSITIDLYANDTLINSTVVPEYQLFNLSNFWLAKQSFLAHVPIGAYRKADGSLSSSDYFEGSLNNVMIFNKAFSADEVNYLYDEGGRPVIPEPASMAFLAFGGLVLFGHKRR
jgi:hypothetical protein